MIDFNYSDSYTDALHIAQILLSYDEIKFTPLKLQKILYYCQAFHLAILEKPLFGDKIVAYTWGSKIEAVYHQYKKYGSDIIDPCEMKPSDDLCKAESLRVISNVLDVYGEMSGTSLMQRTHTEDPWIDAYNQGSETEISLKSMRDFYKSLLVNS
jgi:uncharacterized phage-associated protein